MTRVGVCLSGCGVLDGSEIHEAVCVLLALDEAGAGIVCCAPDVPQADVTDHRTQNTVPGKVRNVLEESARIARGHIRDLAQVTASDLDALVFPGGFGAAKNLCTYAADGADCQVNPDVERLLGEMLATRKPVGAICIAPVLVARVLGRLGRQPRLTIGNDSAPAAALAAMGAKHVNCAVDGVVVDEALKIVTTPAYMLARGPAEANAGIRKLVGEVLRLAAPGEKA
ncbi:MAG: isoprenoid biosynthesis glyoxalase ElbB [bacterium]|nr:isoprenoid biosynthesis glyoxalase ElbB [bacterium]